MRAASLLIVALCAAAPQAPAQDAMKVDSKHHTVLLENDQARVLKARYGPKEKSVMHEHAPHVLIFLEDVQVKSTLQRGGVVDMGGRAGEVRFVESVTHSVENTGDRPAQVIMVELKPRPPLPPRAAALDPVKVASGHHKVEYEDDRVRVLRIRLGGREKTAEHEHPHAIMVYLTDLDARHSLAGGKSRKASGRRGEIAWSPPERHAVENLSDRPAEMILVELKR
jgi:quercetin dioxygenase-like cupin family protein